MEVSRSDFSSLEREGVATFHFFVVLATMGIFNGDQNASTLKSGLIMESHSGIGVFSFV